MPGTRQPHSRGRVSVADARGWCRRALEQPGVEHGPRECDWLLAHVLRLPSADHVHLAAERLLTEAELRDLQQATRRRAAGEPLQYIVGAVDFRGLTLEVGPGVLIPRPETEQLVDLALSLCPGHGPVCDVCTGSGAIALALAAELPNPPCIVGTDTSREALRYATRNRRITGARDVHFVVGDLLTPTRRGDLFALITTNPPYVSPELYEGLPASVREHEPRLALYAGEHGLAVIRRIADSAWTRLARGGWLVSEISSEQGPAVHELLVARGYSRVAIRQDYARRDRFAIATHP